MSGPRAPLSTGQTVVNFDRAHAGFPRHADVVTNLGDGIVQKLRVSGQGNILTDNILASTRPKFQR